MWGLMAARTRTTGRAARARVNAKANATA
jgi:hypothetical protein